MFGLVPSMAGAWGSCGLVDRCSRLDFQIPGTECWVSLSLAVWAHSGHWTSLSLVSQYAKWEAKGELTGVPPKGSHAPESLKKVLCSHFKLHLFFFFFKQTNIVDFYIRFYISLSRTPVSEWKLLLGPELLLSSDQHQFCLAGWLSSAVA